ncbi:LANO_0E09714g1_1 [Lachancea nothofagi CBS 11611]|uniref:LANO_0E09714g1_1 n=1 Tax=Lachancea nothofagi CBS 11611 TaxID=1266666 RepID=A0A1G4JW59_9SACH|nr:LANO_0E09714g1_1 [Lachancea nothofagi CBS 11611]
MAIRISKRLLKVVLLVSLVLGIFGLVLHTTENESALYYADKAKDIVDNQVNKWTTDAAKKEENERKQAEHEAEDGKHREEVPLDASAKQLLSAADAAKEQEVVGDTSASEDTKNATIKAAFVSLVRNTDLPSIIETIRNLEDRFNKKFNYPYVFLNNELFTDDFKSAIKNVISSEAHFGLIPKEHWSYPDWISEEKAAYVRETADYIYGDSESYRHMCRFESGFFWQNELLDDFDWYWRVEPDTKLHCDVDYDVFKFMRDNNKQYGFTVSIKEFEVTIKSLWDTTKAFIQKHPEYVDKNNMMDFISNDKGKSYNLCHFWSNFEVANLNFWRSDAYRKYFDYLDRAGGFFYERWGDAPVHSIAAALFLPRDQIHYFPDIGYFHAPYNNCPLDNDIWKKGKCSCEQDMDFSFQPYSCTNEYYEVNKMKKPAGWKKFRT